MGKKKYIVLMSIMLEACLFMACGEKDVTKSVEVKIKTKSVDVKELEPKESDVTIEIPTKESVEYMRKIVLEGMEQDEIDKMTEDIKMANLVLENAIMHNQLLERLENPNDLYWNYIDCSGKFQIGWAFEENSIYDKRTADLTEEEFNKKYGKPVMAYSEYDAERFIDIMSEHKESINSERLNKDFANLINYMVSAQKFHDVKYIKQIYEILHDMDYFLLRYGLEDVGKYTKDNSTITKYYGVLNVYK